MGAAIVARWPGALFADPSSTEELACATLHTADGEQWPFSPQRWHGLPTQEEVQLLERVEGTVLDIGCGPGRHVLALIRAGRTALGIDESPAAVASAQRRGAPAVLTSVFSTVPDTGSWDTVLLLDGNIGIGGDPVTLLSRVAVLLRPHGQALVEVDRPGVETRQVDVQVEHAQRRSRWIPWARVAAPQVTDLAGACGFTVTELWQAGDRWFADLRCRTSLGTDAAPMGSPALPSVAS